MEIGDFTTIYEDVEIGDNCKIYGNVTVFPGARIGEGVTLYFPVRLFPAFPRISNFGVRRHSSILATVPYCVNVPL